jgi:cation diffusion facilitator family transporter
MSNTHAHEHEHKAVDRSSPERFRASLRVTLVNVTSNLLLTIGQVIVGILGHSQALVADGLHTLSDMVADFLVLFALAHGRKGADAEHPYGHERIETAVTMILGVILIGVGTGIAARAAIKLASGEAFVTPSTLTLWVAIGTLLAKEAMYRYTMHTANRFDSNMLRASAWHHRSDALSSLIVAAGIGGSLLGFAYLDAVAAIVVAAMIVKVGIELAWHSLRELVDTGLDPAVIGEIRRVINGVAGVKALHMLRTRRVGGKALVDVHIIVDDHLSVSEGHQISEAVRTRLMKEVAVISDVMVHIDTEEDVEGPTCAGLPLRDEVLTRLKRYFRDIPEAAHVERTTLHYLDGHIDVDMVLPLDAAPTVGAARVLAARLDAAVKADPDIRNVTVSFH